MSSNQHHLDHVAAVATLVVIAIFVMILPFLNLTPLLSVLLLLTFFTFLTLLANLKWGLFSLLVLRPILDFSSEMPVFEIAETSINLAALLGILLISVTVVKVSDNLSVFRKIPLLKHWAAFLSVATVGVVLSFSKVSSVSELVRISTIFSLFVLSFIAIKSQKELFQLVKVILFSMAIPSIVALYQLTTNTGLTLSYQDVPNRLFGTFAHPNLFAFSLTLSIALSLAMLLIAKKSHQKLIYGASFLISFILLALTYTRGAWILFAFMIFSAGILKLRKLLFFSVIAFCMLYLLVAPVRDRINSVTVLSPYSSITWRFNLWEDAIVYVNDAPLLGHGTGTAEELIMERRGPKFGSTAPHNDFLKVLLETGIAGIITFLAIFLALCQKLLSHFLSQANSKKTNDLGFLVLIFLCFTLGLYAASFGDNIIAATALQWSFWAQAGGILAIIHSLNKKTDILSVLEDNEK